MYRLSGAWSLISHSRCHGFLPCNSHVSQSCRCNGEISNVDNCGVVHILNSNSSTPTLPSCEDFTFESHFRHEVRTKYFGFTVDMRGTEGNNPTVREKSCQPPQKSCGIWGYEKCANSASYWKNSGIVHLPIFPDIQP